MAQRFAALARLTPMATSELERLVEAGGALWMVAAEILAHREFNAREIKSCK